MWSMRFRLATLVRGSSRPDTVLRSRPAHLRVTVVVALAPPPGPTNHHHEMTNNNDNGQRSQRPLDTRVHLRPIAQHADHLDRRLEVRRSCRTADPQSDS